MSAGWAPELQFGVVRALLSSGFALASWLGLVACAGADEGALGSAEAGAALNDSDVVTPDQQWSRTDLERDLKLVLRRSTNEPMEAMRDPGFEVQLENTSSERSYGIVLSSDGSEAGWREPHVWYSVEVSGKDGAFHSLAPEPLARCGVYDQDWFDEARLLSPGERVSLPWFYFGQQWELGSVERVRAQAHYAYGKHAVEQRHLPPELRRTPAFELHSNVLELSLEAPLALELVVLGPLPTAPAEPLGEVIAVTAINRSDRSLPFAELATWAMLQFELQDSRGEISTVYVSAPRRPPSPRDIIWLEPGVRHNAVPSSLLTDSFWRVPDDVRRIRARLHVAIELPDGTVDTRLAVSPWVTAVAAKQQ